jgi:hypothetical protein
MFVGYSKSAAMLPGPLRLNQRLRSNRLNRMLAVFIQNFNIQFLDISTGDETRQKTKTAVEAVFAFSVLKR